MGVDGPRLFEVNTRPAGSLPRAPNKPDQLQALIMSLHDPEKFLALPESPPLSEVSAVVFLCAPCTGWITSAALGEIAALDSFCRFDRGLLDVCRPFTAQSVRKTTGLFSSP